MPVVVPRKVVPIAEARPEPAAPSLTQAEVRAMLAEQAAMFSQQIAAVTQAFSEALASVQNQPKDAPAVGWDFEVEYRPNGAIDTIRATPRKLRTKP